jgi:hypothetical protein
VGIGDRDSESDVIHSTVLVRVAGAGRTNRLTLQPADEVLGMRPRP